MKKRSVTSRVGPRNTTLLCSSEDCKWSVLGWFYASACDGQGTEHSWGVYDYPQVNFGRSGCLVDGSCILSRKGGLRLWLWLLRRRSLQEGWQCWLCSMGLGISGIESQSLLIFALLGAILKYSSAVPRASKSRSGLMPLSGVQDLVWPAGQLPRQPQVWQEHVGEKNASWLYC